MRRLAWAAIALTLLARRAAADTIVPGGNVINQTWTAGGSPYVVQGDVVVPVSSTLTLEAGTEVVFPGGDAQASGADPARVEITVHGALLVQGDVAKPVSFHAQNNGEFGAWYGIVPSADAADVTVHFAHVSDALVGIGSDATSVKVSDSEFSNLQYGINAYGLVLSGSRLHDITQDALLLYKDATVDRVVIQNAGNYAISVNTGNGSKVGITNTLIRDSAWGILAGANDGTVDVVGCTVHACGRGITADGTLVVMNVTNTLITGSTDWGFHVYDGTFNLASCDAWGTVAGNSYDYDGVAQGPGCISANPQYVNPATDLHLAMASVCIDEGTAAALDHDLDDHVRPWDGDGISGAQQDIGAYEYGAPPVQQGSGGGGAGGAGGSGGATGPGGTGSSAGAGGSGGATGPGGTGSSAGAGGAASSGSAGGSGPGVAAGSGSEASAAAATAGAGAGPTSPSDDAGCGCALPGSRRSPAWPALVAAAIAAALGRKRAWRALPVRATRTR